MALPENDDVRVNIYKIKQLFKNCVNVVKDDEIASLFEHVANELRQIAVFQIARNSGEINQPIHETND